MEWIVFIGGSVLIIVAAFVVGCVVLYSVERWGEDCGKRIGG